MPTTPRLALPYPTPDDNPDLPAQMQALADRLDSVVAIPYAGDLKFSARVGEHGNWIKADGRALTAGQYVPLRDALIADGSPFGNTAGDPKLPDLRGRAPVGAGAGAGLTSRAHGASGGAETHLLTAAQSGTQEHEHHMELANAGGAPPSGITIGGKTYALGSAQVNGSNRSLPVPITNGSFNWALGVAGMKGGADDATSAHPNMQPYTVGTWFIYGG